MQQTEPDQRIRHLYLVQHGEAKTKEEDPERPLSETGRKTVEHVAAWAARMGLGVTLIRHSGKLRAEQTAAIFLENLQPPGGMEAYPGLNPHDDVSPVSRAILQWPSSAMIVGHLPFLNRLVAKLVVGKLPADDPGRQIVRFCYGGLVELLHENGQWSIACVAPPELIE